MVDADLLKFNRQSPLSLMVFGISTLFSRPAQSLAPILILSKLNRYGYGEPNHRTLLDLQDSMFSLICVVPLGIATVQILTWSSFSIRNRADYTGTTYGLFVGCFLAFLQPRICNSSPPDCLVFLELTDASQQTGQTSYYETADGVCMHMYLPACGMHK
ncbi:transmembrane protein 180 [Sigmodon hispidus]